MIGPWVGVSSKPDYDRERSTQCDLLRCIFGNPFRPSPPLAPALLAWSEGTAIKLAQAIYDARRFEDLPILADALEEAGCADAALLGHLRSGPAHVRGCWALDLVLAKEPVPSAGRSQGAEVPGLIRFRPSRAEGLPDVREVVVRPDRLEVNTAGSWVTFPFSQMGLWLGYRRQESRVRSVVRRLVGQAPEPVLVAGRDWFRPPRERYFYWYTYPPLRTCMPEDEPADYTASTFFRIEEVLRSGGYTSDLG